MSQQGDIFTMTVVQKHRGPDDYGHVFIGGENPFFVHDASEGDILPSFLAFGHRRLSILDCSEAGRQPFSADNGNYWITYNGEVYNYKELRDELRYAGYTFHTETDTEVILAAYREWGTRCFSRFNGMWGMAIWDAPRQQLILSRDRFGVKPLHYACLDNALIFASEIKGVLASDRVKAKANNHVIADYLKWGVVNHGTETFFDNIHAFPPGHFAVIPRGLPTGMRPEPFWQLENKPLNITANDAEEFFRTLFEDSVRLRMRSDVPVGSCLSGGLDSSAIVCVASRCAENGGQMNTFTSVFDDPRFDERHWATLVNDRVGAKHHFVSPTQEGFLDDLQNLIWHQEEPFTSASIYAQWRVMQSARETSVPVLLDGQGADEILCGYRKFYMLYLRDLAQKGHWHVFLNELKGLVVNGDRGLLRFWEGKRYLPAFLRERTEGTQSWLASEFTKIYYSSEVKLASMKSVAERQKEDLFQFSVPSLLRYEDRNSMAWSIESRVPFLDYRLVELALSFPTNIKLAAGQTKAILRHALHGIVPQVILERRDKMGFVTPQQSWIKDLLGKVMAESFCPNCYRPEQILSPVSLSAALNSYRNGHRRISDGELFRAFLLHVWMERFDVIS
jgi:asparagine synthase (glutamine-hydrolysing)